MLARALIVLLLILNLGVATWWALRPQSAPAAAATETPVARLQLLREVRDSSAPTGPGVGADPVAAPVIDGSAAADAAAVAGSAASTPAAGAAPIPEATVQPATVASVTPSSVARCFSIGPFADPAALAGARRALAALEVARTQEREATSAPRGWSVSMPAMADRAAADAMAARIRAAGFDDLMVVPAGERANSIALGRYSGETSARQRVAALRAGGFAADAQPVGNVAVRHWLDVGTTDGFDLAGARAAVGTDIAPIDCGALS